MPINYKHPRYAVPENRIFDYDKEGRDKLGISLADMVRANRAKSIQMEEAEMKLADMKRKQADEAAFRQAVQKTVSPYAISPVPSLGGVDFGALAGLAGGVPAMPHVTAPTMPTGLGFQQKLIENLSNIPGGAVHIPMIQEQVAKAQAVKDSQEIAQQRAFAQVLKTNPAMIDAIGPSIGMSPEDIARFKESSKMGEQLQEFQLSDGRMAYKIGNTVIQPRSTLSASAGGLPMVQRNNISRARFNKEYGELTPEEMRAVDSEVISLPSEADVRETAREARAAEKELMAEDKARSQAGEDATNFIKSQRNTFTRRWDRFINRVEPGYRNALAQSNMLFDAIDKIKKIDEAMKSGATRQMSAERRQAVADARASAFSQMFQFIRSLDDSVVRQSEIEGYQGFGSIARRVESFLSKEKEMSPVLIEDARAIFNSVKLAMGVQLDAYNLDLGGTMDEIKSTIHGHNPATQDYIQSIERSLRRDKAVTGASPRQPIKPLPPNLSIDSVPAPEGGSGAVGTQTILFNDPKKWGK